MLQRNIKKEIHKLESTNKGERVGVKVLDNGKKVRFFKSNGEVVS